MALSLDQKAPGVIGIFFGVVLSVALGAVLAGVQLAATHVEVVTVIPKEPVEGLRYFIPGTGAASAGKTWVRKRDLITKGSGEVGFYEGDLNAWAQETLRPAAYVEGLKLTEAQKKVIAFKLIPGVPNFRLFKNELQVATINEAIVNGVPQNLVIQATGSFTSSANGWNFVPKEFYIGELPLHKIPVLMSIVMARFTRRDEVPEDVISVFKEATRLEIADSELVVRMP